MSHSKPISTESLADMASAGVVRTVKAVRTGNRWAVEATIGMETRPLRSQREQVRLFAKLDTLERFLRDQIGINRFEVVGQ